MPERDDDEHSRAHDGQQHRSRRGGLALLKFGLSKGFSTPLIVALVAYAAFAAGFGYLVFGLGTACAPGTSSTHA